MQYYGRHSLSSGLKIILDVLLVIGVILLLIVIKGAVWDNGLNISIGRKIFIFALFLVGSSSLLMVVFNLRKIVGTLVEENPFVEKNVKCLKRISIQCFTIAGCYLLNFFFNPKYGEFSFIYIDDRGVHTDMEFIIFLFAGCFILILSKVFQKAVEVKEENDYTI